MQLQITIFINIPRTDLIPPPPQDIFFWSFQCSFFYKGLFLALLSNISSKCWENFQKSCYYVFEIQFEKEFAAMYERKGISSTKSDASVFSLRFILFRMNFYTGFFSVLVSRKMTHLYWIDDSFSSSSRPTLFFSSNFFYKESFWPYDLILLLICEKNFRKPSEPYEIRFELKFWNMWGEKKKYWSDSVSKSFFTHFHFLSQGWTLKVPNVMDSTRHVLKTSKLQCQVFTWEAPGKFWKFLKGYTPKICLFIKLFGVTHHKFWYYWVFQTDFQT